MSGTVADLIFAHRIKLSALLSPSYIHFHSNKDDNDVELLMMVMTIGEV